MKRHYPRLIVGQTEADLRAQLRQGEEIDWDSVERALTTTKELYYWVADPAQVEAEQAKSRVVRGTQCDRLLTLLKEHQGHWVSLPLILALGIAQYNARILELRRQGHRIESRVEWDSANGRRYARSWFRLLDGGTHDSAA